MRLLPIWDRMQAKLDTLVKIIRGLISDRYVCKGEREREREVFCFHQVSSCSDDYYFFFITFYVVFENVDSFESCLFVISFGRTWVF